MNASLNFMFNVKVTVTFHTSFHIHGCQSYMCAKTIYVDTKYRGPLKQIKVVRRSLSAIEFQKLRHGAAIGGIGAEKQVLEFQKLRHA